MGMQKGVRMVAKCKRLIACLVASVLFLSSMTTYAAEVTDAAELQDEQQHTLIVQNDDNGSVTVEGDGITQIGQDIYTVQYDSKIKVTAEPKEGYVLETVIPDSGMAGSLCRQDENSRREPNAEPVRRIIERSFLFMVSFFACIPCKNSERFGNGNKLVYCHCRDASNAPFEPDTVPGLFEDGRGAGAGFRAGPMGRFAAFG